MHEYLGDFPVWLRPRRPRLLVQEVPPRVLEPQEAPPPRQGPPKARKAPPRQGPRRLLEIRTGIADLQTVGGGLHLVSGVEATAVEKVAGRSKPPFEDEREAVLGVARCDLVGALQHSGMGVGHRHPPAGPVQHRQIIGHVTQCQYVSWCNAQLAGQPSKTGALVDTGSGDLDQTV